VIAVNGRSAIRSLSVVLRLLVVALVVGIHPTLADRTEPVWWVSAPVLKVAYPELVIAFQLDATNCRVRSVVNIPQLWYANIKNDESGAA
jgi:hypothetical protein